MYVVTVKQHWTINSVTLQYMFDIALCSHNEETVKVMQEKINSFTLHIPYAHTYSCILYPIAYHHWVRKTKKLLIVMIDAKTETKFLKLP